MIILSSERYREVNQMPFLSNSQFSGWMIRSPLLICVFKYLAYNLHVCPSRIYYVRTLAKITGE